jgi:hypothetical protein
LVLRLPFVFTLFEIRCEFTKNNHPRIPALAGLAYICSFNSLPVKIFRFVFVVFVFSACLNQPDCVNNSTNVVKIAFKTETSAAREITFTAITVSGLNKKFYTGTKASAIDLPVDPDQSQTTYTFTFEDRTEVIVLNYKRTAQLISAACGAFLNFSQLQVEDTTFENYRIVNNQLVKNATVNLEIFIE